MPFTLVDHRQEILQEDICLFESCTRLTKGCQIFSLDLIERRPGVVSLPILRIRASQVLFARGGISALGQAAITIAKREGVTVFPFEHIPDVHRLMEANGTNGKIVVLR